VAFRAVDGVGTVASLTSIGVERVPKRTIADRRLEKRAGIRIVVNRVYAKAIF
jgi:hypothetical protein